MNSSMPMTALPPPEGYETNLVNPPYIGNRGIAACAVSMILSTTILMLRLYTRKFVVRILGWDDLFIVLAWTGAVVLSACGFAQSKVGAGRHMWDVLIPEFETFLKIQMVAGTGYIVATCFAKISICTFYLRLSPARTFRMLVIAVIVFTVADSIAVILVYYFSCNPIAASWDLTLAADPATVCINRPAEYLAQAGINIFTDFAIFLLPVSTIWHLQLPFRQRVGVIAIFATGFFVCIVSIIRIRAVINVLNSPDLTWLTTDFTIWSVLEAHIGVVCACMATLKPIIKRLLPCLSRGGSTPTYPEIPGRSTKLPSNLRSSRHAFALKGYPARTGDNEITVVGGKPRDDSDAGSQEHIIDSSRFGSKDGVYVTRTVEIS